MSRRALASAVVLVGGLLVLVAAVAGLVLAAGVVTGLGGVLLYGTLVAGLVLILIGCFGIDVEPREPATGERS